nr:uncharacterized protein LOC122321445 [Drosophila bipectinata]
MHQRMADLPSVRTQDGCDYAGPILLKDAKERKPRMSKGYMPIRMYGYVGDPSRTRHRLIYRNISSGIETIFSIRGKCTRMYSDNGTNFIGARRSLDEMQQLLSSTQHKDHVANSLADEGIQWTFIPPRAPHWGGKWESAVRCVKLHLRRVIGSSTLTHEQMRTLLAQISAVVNSRPLCYTSDTDSNYLSPAHFLIGRPITTIPEADLGHIPVGRLGYWQSIQSMY